jgi:hypothetical protein
MKYLKLFEDYSKEEIRNFLVKAQQNSQIDIKTNIDNLMNNLSKIKRPELGTFEYFVNSEARFISEGDYKRMGEYIEGFKKLGIDVSKVEELYPKLLRYKTIELKELDNYEHGYSQKEKEKNLDRLYDELDDLEPYKVQFDDEVKILTKKAKQLDN